MKLTVATDLQRFTLSPLRVSTILLGFTVPISVALDNLLLALLLLGALFNLRAVWRTVVQHPVARAAWLLFAVLLFATFYGATPLREATGILAKYLDLAFIPMFMLMLSNGHGRSAAPDDEACHASFPHPTPPPQAREWANESLREFHISEAIQRKAQHAFLAAMGLTLLLSFLVGLGLLPVQHWMNTIATPDNPVIFHSHITQNNMMAFAVFLALLNLRDAASRGVRVAWGLFALLGTINVLFMVQGRTGYVILLVLLGWFAWSTLARHMRGLGKAWGWRQGIAVILVLLGLAAAAYQASPRLHDRAGLVASEFHAWQPDHGKDTSTGRRLDFYHNTLQIVQQHPVFGVGTGGFADAFMQQTQGKDVMQTRNPHNEYLMITVQTGVIGLALLLYLFYTQWRCSALLDTSFRQDAARGLVFAYLTNSMFNSPLLDHADGLFFAFMTAVLFANLKPAVNSAERVGRHG